MVTASGLETQGEMLRRSRGHGGYRLERWIREASRTKSKALMGDKE